ncbi:hypothetical protein LIER_39573 [Lithospermum erythrorhizon]|uniref:Uncharacterized protein n=1 Tax=Lithospermum erythrorhizon TaxID=34254 RepID=A0AAV3QKR8_LITER
MRQSGAVLSPIEEEGGYGVGLKSTYAAMVATRMVLNSRKVSKNVLKGSNKGSLKGDVPSSVNDTTLSLIPKVEHPSSAKEYRPISCCNNIYKAITKELVHGYHREDGVPKAVIKVDL